MKVGKSGANGVAPTDCFVGRHLFCWVALKGLPIAPFGFAVLGALTPPAKVMLPGPPPKKPPAPNRPPPMKFRPVWLKLSSIRSKTDTPPPLPLPAGYELPPILTVPDTFVPL